MKNFICFALVFGMTTVALANRSEKLKKSIAIREEVKEQKREIARLKTEEHRKKTHSH